MQRRFERQAKRWMTDRDFSAWVAARAIGEAVTRATAIGEEIALRGPLAVREAKRLIDLSSETDIDAGLAAELDASDRIFATDDMLEGAASFFGKRDPEYRGR